MSPAGPWGKEVAFSLLGHVVEKSVLKTLLLVLELSGQVYAGYRAGEEIFVLINLVVVVAVATLI